jgi:hypothetical protein
LRGNFNNIPGFAGYELVYMPYVRNIQGEQMDTTYKDFLFDLFAVVNNNQYIQEFGGCIVTVDLNTNKPVDINILIANTPDDSYDPNNVETL